MLKYYKKILVIVKIDVENVIEIMGKPEEFTDESNLNSSSDNDNQVYNQPNQNSNPLKTRKLLFRNLDDKIIGGVCSGVATYLDINVKWVRLTTVGLVFFGGLSIWIYLLMWILVPFAQTTADKLAMKGEAINIDTISKSVKEEANEYKNGNNSYSNRFAANASFATNKIVDGIIKLIGLFSGFLGIVFIMLYVAVIFGISISDSSGNVFENWKNAIFTSSFDSFLALLSFMIVFGIIIYFFIYIAIRLIFQFRHKNKMINYGIGAFGILGITLGFFVIIKTVKQFTEVSKIKTETQFLKLTDTLIVTSKPISEVLKKYTFDNNEEIENELKYNRNDYCFGESLDGNSLISNAKFDIVQSYTDSVELSVFYISRGPTKQEANTFAKEIKFDFEYDKNKLIIDKIFSVSKNQKFRAQDVKIKIKLPKGKVIYLDKSLENNLENVENVSNTWDGEMAGRHWKMTEKGLECVDCKGLETLKMEEEEIAEN